MNRRRLGIYVHIPFCIKKCLYCDFLSFVSCKEEREEYIQALIKEIRYGAIDDESVSGEHEVQTIFIGGGTPSILDSSQIQAIFEAIRERFCVAADAEITIECNPGSVTREKVTAYKEAGINRVSIGLQSADDEQLKILGRIHDYNQFLETYRLFREAGFTNINIDIMSAIPKQTLQSYDETLSKVISLAPEHISAYSLIIEEDTPFYETYGEDSRSDDLVDEDTEREMYYLTENKLAEAGYHRYEISNYSLEGYECEHNKSYWTGVDYIGFGVGAASYCNGVRYNNTSDIYSYISACNRMENTSYEPLAEGISLSPKELFGQVLLAEKYHEDIQLLSNSECMEEYMILGLRMMKGVTKSGFLDRFHVSIEEIYGKAIDKLNREGLLIVDGDYIRLSTRGIDVSNVVFGYFLA